MQIDKRKSKIISELLDTDDCITGQYLANVTGVTARTIRGDISELNSELMNSDIKIHAISGKGYYISKEKKLALMEIVKTDQAYVIPIIPSSRVNHILMQLLLNPKGILVSDILNQLYVSESTLVRDFGKVNQRLKAYKLCLIKNQNEHLTIYGDELIIRAFYRDFLSELSKANAIDQSFSNKPINEIINKIKEKIIRVIDAYKVDLSGDEFDEMFIFLTVTYYRITNGFLLKSYDKKCSYENDYLIRIIDFLNGESKLNMYEEYFIKDFFKKAMYKEDNTQEIVKMKKILIESIDVVSETFKYVFTNELSEKLLNLLSCHHYPNTREHALHDIKTEYPLAFEMGVELVNDINHQLELCISEEILANIVLTFACEMEEDILKEQYKKRDIVFVCQSGELINNLIEIKLKRYFIGFNILGFLPPYKIKKIIEMKPEIVISTVGLDQLDMPVVVIDPLFKDYDVIKINAAIKQIDNKESSHYDFVNLFKEDLFTIENEFSDKQEAIRKLSKMMHRSGKVGDDFFDSVVEREHISSTSIGNMVAIPHAIGGGRGENVVALGIFKNPINWNGDKVQIVFLISIQNASDRKVKQIFGSFFDLISSKSKVERVVKSKNYYEFIKTISQ